MKKSIGRISALLMSAILFVGGCGSTVSDTTENENSQTQQSVSTQDGANTSDDVATNGDVSDVDNEKHGPEIAGLTYKYAMNLTYATEFDVYYYEDGYKLLDVHEDKTYLVVPDGKDVPDGLDKDIVVLQQPTDHIYMAATAIMSLFDAMDALSNVKFSGVNSSGWYIEDAKAAMEAGDMAYAGKYSEPDYETLINGDCNLAIESTMILHTPKVQEMIEDLGIPVFVDYSSYETHPLGRTEWIKLYGAMLNKEDEAKAFFDEQAQVIEKLKGFENTEKTVAYFYVNTDGSIVVRKSDDYIPSMIEIAGGRYVFKDLKNPDSNAPAVKLTMEEFYATAVDTDYLIYNGTIDGQVSSISELEAKSELFADFKAVKDGNVWYTGKNLYQATDTVGELIMDMHLMLTGGDANQMTFLEKMQ
jgi:iron complex transport system substrate-binding protein